MHRSVAILLMILAIHSLASLQEPAPQSEHQQLEEEHVRFRAESGQSHASGAHPELGPVVLGNPTAAVVALRVGLHTTTFTSGGAVATEFSSLHHGFVELTNTDGDVKVIDRSSGREVSVMTPGAVVRVDHNGTQFRVTQADVVIGEFDGPIFFRPTSELNFFRVEHIRRVFLGTHRPLYRGAMEVGRGTTTAGLIGPPRVNLWNIVEVEQYVPGVVANESIASFASEALKAQAVAARGYAIANIGNYIRRGYQFDIVDSAASQVYRGVVSEHVNAVKAAAETHGLVASHTGQIISAMYSSSFGGHSEDNEWISFTLNRATGGAPSPYLRGIYDGQEPPPDLSTDAGIDLFWRANPPSPQIYDECTWTGNTFSRWSFALSAVTIKARMTDANSVLVEPPGGTRLGVITDLAIVQRGDASKRSVSLRVTFTTGVYDVLGWEGIRGVIGRTSSPSGGVRACNPNPNLPPTALPANFTLNNPSGIDVAKNLDGSVSQVMVYGGGWGHNLGMSQYGAHGRGKHGQLFIDILKAYYTGVDVGSYPIDIGREPGSGSPTLRQEFYAPNALGTLQIRPQGGLKGLRVHINELHDLSFDEAALASDLVSVDVSTYLVPGVNVIQYNPVGRQGSATVTVVVR